MAAVVHRDAELIERVLARDPVACRTLVDQLTKVIQRQVNAALIRRGRGSRSDVLDLTQEIFRLLLDDDGKILRAWDPERGATLNGYVALIAERRIESLLRSGRRSGWAETSVDPFDLEDAGEPSPSVEDTVIPREELRLLLEILRAGLSDRAYEMFVHLYVEERDVQWVAENTGMSRDAVYAYRARLQKAIAKAAAHLAASNLQPSKRRNSK